MEKIAVFSLGGVGEIGKNMYVVTVGKDIFVLDAGFSFPKQGMYGIDFVIPDISYLLERKDQVKGIFLTHGHEDHIGAVAYIMEQLNVPIYGTAVTLALVEERMTQVGVKKKRLLNIIHKDSELHFGETRISFIQMTHSIPGAVGICIHTPQGCIIYTGDFKIDLHPIDNKKIDFARLAQLEKEGVLCLLSDSTNAEKLGRTPSERQVRGQLQAIFERAEGRVLVATFASHLHRIQQIVDVAKETNRKVAIMGTKMLQVFELAKELGEIIVPEDVMISAADLHQYPKKQLAIIMTGAQGEPFSALARIATKANDHIVAGKGDTIIMSATTIPGNELTVAKMVDKLLRAGVEHIYQQVHVSGHGSQEELKMMISLLQPTYFIPVHGEYRMQKAHACLAEELQIPKENIFLLDKGETVEFVQQRAKIGPKVCAGNVFIDGLGVGDIGNIVLRDRKQFAQNGVFIVTVFFRKSERKMIKKPIIQTKGFINVKESADLIQLAMTKTIEVVEASTEWLTLKGTIRDALQQLFYDKTKRRPMILPIIMEI